MIYIEYFFVFAFAGWVIEIIYHATSQGIVVNRGFLNGPICPIYGVGMIGMRTLLDNVAEMNSLEIFLFGAVVSASIELIAGFLLHKLFHARWWDYSDKPFNFKGYICLEFTLIWGVAVLTTVKVICPVVDNTYLPEKTTQILLTIFTIIFLVDLALSVSAAIGLNKKLTEIDVAQRRMRIVSDKLSKQIGENALKTTNKLEEGRIQLALAKEEAEDDLKIRLSNLDKQLSKTKYFGEGRLLRAFPNLKNRNID